jgi:CHASE2 domain-containing sensor protein
MPTEGGQGKIHCRVGKLLSGQLNSRPGSAVRLPAGMYVWCVCQSTASLSSATSTFQRGLKLPKLCIFTAYALGTLLLLYDWRDWACTLIAILRDAVIESVM